MNIALAYNVKRSSPDADPTKQIDLEFDSPEVTAAQKKAIESFGHKVTLVEADENAFFKLKELKGKIDLVFNLAEGLWGDARESQIPIFCEILKIPYTHSDPTTHAIGLDKAFAKLVLKGAEGINVPESHVFTKKGEKMPGYLKFPLIVKPNKEGSSKGVLDANVVDNEADLFKRVEAVSDNFTKEVLAEEYIEGREFTVAVLGNDELKVLPIIEQRFDFLPEGMHKIASFELKWLYEDALSDPHDAFDCPAILDEKTKKDIESTSKEVFRLLDIRDIARIDYRLNEMGKLYFIEVNTIPGMMPPDIGVISYLTASVIAAGMSYNDLIGEIINLAKARYGI